MPRILLAEDDIDDQEMLAEIFSEMDPSVELFSFSTGKKFLTYLENLADNEIPEMIILDYNIPELNGAEILKLLKDQVRFQSMIKLVWSTSNSSLFETYCLSMGARAYLVKPSNISGLQEMAKTMLSYLS